MKKTFLCILTFLFAAAVSDASTDKRIEWWNAKLSSQMNERDFAVKNGFSPEVMDLINKDIVRSRDVIRELKKFRSGEGEYAVKQDFLDVTDIRKSCNKLTDALLPLYLAGYVVTGSGSQEWNDKSFSAALQQIHADITESFPSTDRSFSERLVNSIYLTHHKKYLSFEYFITNYMESYQELRSRMAETIYTNAVSEIGFAKMTDEEIYKTLARTAVYTLEGSSFRDLVSDKENLIRKSWVFKANYSYILRKIDLYKKAVRFTGNKKIADAELMNGYVDRPDTLEKECFTSLYQQCANDEKFKRTSVEKPLNLIIPREPQLSAALLEMDALRAEKIKKITGLEDDGDFKDMSLACAKIISNRMQPAGNVFAREENKLKAYLQATSGDIKESKETDKTYTKETLEEYKEFFESKQINARKRHLAQVYAARTVDFLRWYSQLKKNDSEMIVNDYTYRVSRNRDYVGFLLLLHNEALDSSNIVVPFVNSKFTALRRYAADYIRSVGFTTSLEKEYRGSLRPSDFVHVNALAGDYLKFSRSSETEITKLYSTYGANVQMNRKTARSSVTNNSAALAKYEVDRLAESIHDYYDLHEKLSFDREFLENYSRQFNAVYDSAKKGVVSAQVKTAVDKKSILPLVGNYDEASFKTAYRSKEYLARSLVREIARLKQLTDYYRSQKCDVSMKVIDQKGMMARLSKKDAVTIGSWNMNAVNYADVDRKAADLLTKLYDRKIWDGTAQRTDSTGVDSELKIAIANVSVSIPSGWNASDDNKKDDVYASFVNSYDNSSITIRTLPVSSESEKDVADRIVRGERGRIIKIGYGKTSGMEYYWNISETSSKNIQKTYAFEKNGFIIVVSGISDKKRYSFFAPKVESVVQSVK